MPCYLISSHKLKSCTKCRQMAYCGRDCQLQDWKAGHKLKECDFLASPVGKLAFGAQRDFYRNLLRFIVKVKFEPNVLIKEHRLFDGRSKKIDDLMYHLDLYQEEDEKMQGLKMLGEHFTEIGFVDSVEDLLIRLSQLNTNSFAICNPGEFTILLINCANYPLPFFAAFEGDLNRKHVGNGLFIEASCFDHSCRPNAERRFIGTKIQVFALDTIDTSKEEVLISYLVDSHTKLEARQKTLKDNFNFDCNCVRCDGKANQKLDDAICDKYARNKQLENQLTGKAANCELSSKLHNLAMERFELSGQLLGKHSHIGSVNLLNAIAHIFNTLDASLISQDGKVLDKWAEKKRTNQLVSQLKEHLAVTNWDAAHQERVQLWRQLLN